MDYDMKVDRRIGETVLRQQLLNRLQDLRGQPEGPVRTTTIERVQAALQRIADGRFGMCTRCGEALDLQRLMARPETERCAACRD